MKGNNFGIQKVKEQDVMSNLDIASNVGNSTAMGAKIGAQIGGPHGAVIGGVAMGTTQLINQNALKKSEKRQLEIDQKTNKFVDSLSGRQIQSQYYSPIQMKKGMKMKGKYKIGEIEGDGSNSKNGIGEIHTDKNYNIKTVPFGGKRHEQGGVKVEMKKGDVVFPTQNSKESFNKVFNLINRFKLNGDQNAKKELDRIKNELPSESDYDTYRKGKGNKRVKQFPNSGRNFSFLKENKTENSNSQSLSPFTYGTFKENKFGFKEKENLIPNDGSPLYKKDENNDKAYDWTKDIFDKKLLATSDNVEIVKKQLENKPLPTLEKNGLPFKLFSDYLKDNEVEKESKQQQEIQSKGQEMVQNQLKIDEQKEKNKIVDFILNNQDVNNPKELADRAQKLGIPEKDLLDTLDVIHKDITPNITGSRNSTLPYGNIGPKTYGAFKLDTPKEEKPKMDFQQVEPKLEVENPKVEVVETKEIENPKVEVEKQKEEEQKKSDSETDESNSEFDEGMKPINDRFDPMRYSNVLNNLASGNQNIDRVMRRFFTPEELKYKDLSYNDRRTSLENRNFRGNLLRGKGLSSGQQQGYLSQIANAYKKEQEAINEREAQRYSTIEQYNLQNRNQARLQNLGLANDYDTQDAQSEAVKKAYKDVAFKEMSDLAESRMREKYTRDKDERAFEIQKAAIPLYGTGDYEYVNGNWTKPVYKKRMTKKYSFKNKNKTVNGTFNDDGTFNSEK